jgi:hypothetical protein
MDMALTAVADYEAEDAYVTSGHHQDHAKPVLVTLSGVEDVSEVVAARQ